MNLVPLAAPVLVVGIVMNAYTNEVPKIELMKAVSPVSHYIASKGSPSPAPFLEPAKMIFPPASMYWNRAPSAPGRTWRLQVHLGHASSSIGHDVGHSIHDLRNDNDLEDTRVKHVRSH